MTSPFPSILHRCQEEHPALVYLGIGCAHAPLQQYPPFLKEFGGRQICILIDPALEESLLHETPNGVIFLYLRRYFEWETESTFIEGLCQLPGAQLIAQDYSGTDIYPYYPLQKLGPAILRTALFDATYGTSESSCYVDFSTIHILRMDDGAFINPLYEPLTVIRPHISPALFGTLIRDRNIAIRNVNILNRIRKGEEPTSNPVFVQRYASKLYPIYGAHPSDHERLMVDYLTDLSYALDNTSITQAAILDTIEAGNYMTIVDVLLSLYRNLGPG